MPLPKELTTVTPFSKGLALCMFIFLPLVAFVGGVDFQKRADSLAQQKLQYELQNSQNQIKELSQDLALASNNQGRLIFTITQPYSYERFGIYSPLFEQKNITIGMFKYKTTVITRCELALPQENNVNYNVVVYEAADNDNLVSFDQYENYGLRAVSIDDIKKNWTDRYKGTHDMWYWVGTGSTKVQTSVHLQTTRNFSASGKKIFIDIIARGFGVEGASSAHMAFIKEKLKSIADSIVYHL